MRLKDWRMKRRDLERVEVHPRWLLDSKGLLILKVGLNLLLDYLAKEQKMHPKYSLGWKLVLLLHYYQHVRMKRIQITLLPYLRWDLG